MDFTDWISYYFIVKAGSFAALFFYFRLRRLNTCLSADRDFADEITPGRMNYVCRLAGISSSDERINAGFHRLSILMFNFIMNL